MPAADKSLIAWAVVIYIAATLAVCSTTTYTCHAPSDYGPQNKVICNVSYTDTLVLECPDPASQKAAFWMKAVNESYPVTICNAEGPKCNLNANRNLTNQDSGTYFCRIPTADGSDFHLSYVEVNTLAPPSLLGVAYCANSRSCTYPALVGHIREDFTLNVSWGGIGPFSVEWKHNGTDFNCQHPYCEQRNSTNKTSLVLLANPHPDDFPGIYSANISNNFGWNMSHMDVIIDRCQDLDHAEPLSQDSSTALTDGSGANLTCALLYTSEAWLTVCYGEFNQSFSDFTNDSINNQYCTFCPPSSSGDCRSLPQKPGWEVYRQEEGPCKEKLVNVITIKDFAKEDEGRIFCFYGDDEDPYELYTTHTLTYVNISRSSKSYTLYIAVGVVCACIMVLIAIVAVYLVWRKKKNPPSQASENLPSTPSIIVSETRTVRNPRTYRGRICRSGEGERLIPRLSRHDSDSSSNSSYGSTTQDTDWPDPGIQSDFLQPNEQDGVGDC